MKKTSSIARVIFTLICAGIIFYSSCLFLVIYNQLNRGFQKFFHEELEPQSEIISKEFNAVLSKLEKTLNWVKSSYEKESTKGEVEFSFMTSLAKDACAYYDAFSVCFYDMSGHQQTSLDYGIIHNDELILRCLAGESISEVYKEGNNLYALIAKPLINNGKQVGVVAGNQLISSEEILYSIASYTNCDFSIFNGNRCAHTSIKGLKSSILDDDTPIKNAMNGEKTYLLTTINGEEYLSLYFPLMDPRGNFVTTLFLGKKLQAVHMVTYSIFSPLMFFAVIFTVLFLIGLIAMMRIHILGPLRKVSKAVKNLSSGEADLTVRLPVKGNDEFASLSSDVNTFVELLQSIVQKLRGAQDSLISIGESLSSNSQESASATTQILANIESVRKQSENQNNAVSNTNQLLDVSTMSVDSLGEMIDRQDEIIENSSASIEHMLENITSVTNAIKKMEDSFSTLTNTVSVGNTKMSNVNGKVEQMSEQSKTLMNANKMISSIAYQTNLLAMNAAIEAAHAGDAGREDSVLSLTK